MQKITSLRQRLLDPATLEPSPLIYGGGWEGVACDQGFIETGKGIKNGNGTKI